MSIFLSFLVLLRANYNVFYWEGFHWWMHKQCAQNSPWYIFAAKAVSIVPQPSTQSINKKPILNTSIIHLHLLKVKNLSFISQRTLTLLLQVIRRYYYILFCPCDINRSDWNLRICRACKTSIPKLFQLSLSVLDDYLVPSIQGISLFLGVGYTYNSDLLKLVLFTVLLSLIVCLSNSWQATHFSRLSYLQPYKGSNQMKWLWHEF